MVFAWGRGGGKRACGYGKGEKENKTDLVAEAHKLKVSEWK